MAITLTAISATPSGALTTLARVKEHLGIADAVTTYDDKLTNMLEAASRAVEKYCDRLFLEESNRTEYHNGGEDYFQLDLAPVTSSVRLRYAQDCLAIRNSHAETYEATVSASATGLTLTRNGSDSTLLYATYTTITTLAAAVTALGDGWAGGVENSNGSLPSTRIRALQGVLDAKESAAYLELFLPYNHRVRVNNATGKVDVVWSPRGYRNVEAYYSGGWAIADMPEDLQSAVASFTASIYRQSSRDLTIQSEKLGDYSYSNFADTKAMGASLDKIDPVAAEMLRPYRRVHAL